MDLKKLQQVKLEMATKVVGTDMVLVPLKENVADLDVMFTLNEVGTFVWDELSTAESTDELVIRVLEEFEIDKNTAKEDVLAFLAELEGFVGKAL